MTLGERIAKCRKDRNLSQEYVAEQLGVTRQAVSKWENNISAPDTHNLIALAKFFDVTVEYISCGNKIDERNANIADRAIPSISTNIKPLQERKDKKPRSCLTMGIGFLIAGYGGTGFILNLLLPLRYPSSFSIVNLVVCGVILFVGLKIMDLL